MFQMLPKQRCRNITGIVFESDGRKGVSPITGKTHGDHWYEDLVSYMCMLHVPCAVSPIHTDPYSLEDVQKWLELHTDDKTGKLKAGYEDRVPKVGDEHEAHAHIVFSFPGAKSRDQITKMMEGYCHIRETMWQEVLNMRGMIRYFCHLDEIDPKQIKYDVRKLYAFGGLDVSALVEDTEMDKLHTLMDITQYAEDNKIKHYSVLVRKCLSEGDTLTFKVLSSRAPYFAAYFKGKSDERMEAAAKKERESKINGKV